MVPFFDPWPYVNMCKLCKGSFSGIPKIRQVKSSNGINGMRGVSSWPGMTLTPVPAMYESAQLLLILSCYLAPEKNKLKPSPRTVGSFPVLFHWTSRFHLKAFNDSERFTVSPERVPTSLAISSKTLQIVLGHDFAFLSINTWGIFSDHHRTFLTHQIEVPVRWWWSTATRTLSDW